MTLEDNNQRTIWLVVSSGFFDDIRVRKYVEFLTTLLEPPRIRVLAMNRKGVSPNSSASLPHGPEVELYGDAQDQFARICRKAASRVGFMRWAIRRIRHLSSPSDVIHCHDLDTALIGLIARRRSQRVIVDMHEIYSGRARLSIASRKLFSLLERVLLPRADGVIFVSNAASQYYGSRMRLSSTAIVTNSRSQDEIVDVPPPRDSNEPMRIAYIGRFSVDRGLEALTASMGLLPDTYCLDLIGFGPLKDRLKELSLQLPAGAGSVRILPPIPLDQVVQVLSTYDCGAVLTEASCLNHELTVSNKLFEYAAAGLPILASPVSEHRRILDAYPCGIITTVNPSSIADAVRRLSSDPEFTARAQRAARNLALDRSWEVEASKVLQLYGHRAVAG